ncbi:IclR family transcriptional regulator [Aquabacter spiritensis]|uniref:IclR family transcriptional regulator n=1 Tax=Aquabacter spiritensis TaxID=933073 RepID=A0A4R3LW72_9HYPH|nr:IclR family transcriptional regulator [Aquabacter spiritensis]TCT04376.1 IclR family transcriptional regulator [Aquabacter spiritensis]
MLRPPASPPADPEPKTGGVQSLERAFGILEEVARHRQGISLAELAKAIGLHNSTTFHLAKTMVSLGYLRQERDTKRYHLGGMVFSLAANALNEIELVGVATPILEQIARDTGETAHFALRSGDDVVVAARALGPGAFQLVDRAGGLRPAHCTGLGKVLLAALTPEAFEAYLATAKLDPWTAKSITDPAELRADIERVRKHGVAYDDGEFDTEVRCIAVPVRDFTGRTIGSLGISGPIWRLTLQRVEEKRAILLQAADKFSSELGHPGGR